MPGRGTETKQAGGHPVPLQTEPNTCYVPALLQVTGMQKCVNTGLRKLGQKGDRQVGKGTRTPDGRYFHVTKVTPPPTAYTEAVW